MAETGDNHGTEIKAHSETYSGFASMMKWGTLATILVTALVVFLISK